MKPDKALLWDIHRAATRAMEVYRSTTYEEFRESWRDQTSVAHLLTVVGEAAKNLSSEFRAAHPAVRWKDMAGLRDVIVHQYDKVDVNRIWNLFETDLPQLIAYLEEADIDF